jgi:putative intracellular protease/amidase
MKSKVVEDRELLTGQDPFAAKKFGEYLVSKIHRARGNTAQ